MESKLVRIAAVFLVVGFYFYPCGASDTTGGTLDRSRRDTEFRIVGGVEAKKHEFPWMALGSKSIAKMLAQGFTF